MPRLIVINWTCLSFFRRPFLPPFLPPGRPERHRRWGESTIWVIGFAAYYGGAKAGH
jgi:hypothetical protein